MRILWLLFIVLLLASCVRQARSKTVIEETSPGGAITSRTSMENGRRHGSFEMFHPGGRLAIRGDYANGMRHGTFSFYKENGDLDRRVVYERDQIVWDSASRVTASRPPRIAAIAAAAPRRVPVEMGLELHGLLGPNNSAERVDAPLKPAAPAGVGAALSATSSIVRLAVGADFIPSDAQLYHLYVGGLLGVELRAPGRLRALRIQAALELGGHRFGGIGEGRVFETAPAVHWTLYSGLRVGLSIPLRTHLALSVQIGHRRDRTRDQFTLFESGTPIGPIGYEMQDWEAGGITTFGILGLRFALRP